MKLRRWLEAAVLGLIALTPHTVGASELSLDLSAPSAGMPSGGLPFSLYKPAAEPPARRRWPTLYLMHGVNGAQRDWPIMGHVQQTVDTLIAAGRIKPLMIVMPWGGASWFVDNPDPGGAGMVSRAVTRDLPDFIEKNLPALACRGGRATGGLSMGGYGALLYAMDHPREYAAAFSLSGAIWAPMPDDPEAFAKRPTRMFHGSYGEPLDARRFNAWNLFPRLPAYIADKDRTPFYFAVGDDDFASLRNANKAIVAALADGGVAAPFRSDPGRHDWALWEKQLAPALEWLDGKLSRDCPG